MKEGTRQRRAFDLYVHLGAGRSLEELQRQLQARPELIGVNRGPSRTTIEAWSSAFHWQDRFLDLERQARQQDEAEQVRALREMGERHAREGLALQQKGIERLNALLPGELQVPDAIRAIIEGVKLERLARGEPTEHVRQEGAMLYGHLDLSHFSVEELRRLAELAEGGSGGAGEAQPG
jgi:hypothetical protein